MDAWPDPALVALFGSRARLLTLAALANSAEPLTGYRVSRLTAVPPPKVYGEIRKGLATGLLRRERGGFTLVDDDVRSLLRRRVRISWDKEWDRSRGEADASVGGLYDRVLASLPDDPEFYRPKDFRPSPETLRHVRSKVRPPEKDRILRRAGASTSYREGWSR